MSDESINSRKTASESWTNGSLSRTYTSSSTVDGFGKESFLVDRQRVQAEMRKRAARKRVIVRGAVSTPVSGTRAEAPTNASGIASPSSAVLIEEESQSEVPNEEKTFTLRDKIYCLFDTGADMPSLTYAFASTAFAILLILTILLSVVIVVIESLPKYEDSGSHTLQNLEVGCVALFTFEFTMRVVFTRDRRSFVRDQFNWVDIASILPFYLTLTYRLIAGEGGAFSLVFLRTIRLVRVFRVFKLGQYSKTVNIVLYALSVSFESVTLLFFLFFIATVLFSSLLFLAEQSGSTFDEDRRVWIRNDGTRNPFASIPHTFWFVMATLTTTGYGEEVPFTAWGKLVTGICIIAGTLLLCCPVIMISHNFRIAMDCYAHAEAEQKREEEEEKRRHSKAAREKRESVAEKAMEGLRRLSRGISEDDEEERSEMVFGEAVSQAVTEECQSREKERNCVTVVGTLELFLPGESDGMRVNYSGGVSEAVSRLLEAARELEATTLRNPLLAPRKPLLPANTAADWFPSADAMVSFRVSAVRQEAFCNSGTNLVRYLPVLTVPSMRYPPSRPASNPFLRITPSRNVGVWKSPTSSSSSSLSSSESLPGVFYSVAFDVFLDTPLVRELASQAAGLNPMHTERRGRAGGSGTAFTPLVVYPRRVEAEITGLPQGNQLLHRVYHRPGHVLQLVIRSESSFAQRMLFRMWKNVAVTLVFSANPEAFASYSLKDPMQMSECVYETRIPFDSLACSEYFAACPREVVPYASLVASVVSNASSASGESACEVAAVAAALSLLSAYAPCASDAQLRPSQPSETEFDEPLRTG